MDVISRHHLRSDAVREIESRLTDAFGMDVDASGAELVEFADTDTKLVLIDGDPHVAYFDDRPSPTVQGANAYPPSKRVVIVDAGAVQFVSDGADIMRPGIVEADGDINPDDIVIIAEESHQKVLAIGRSRVPGTELLGDSGKVIDSIHHVGDDLYTVSI